MKKFIAILLGSLLVSSLSHMFFVYEWVGGTYMAGPNDGLNQMLPFKQLLYENYTQGNFFYSFQFGFGGGFYGQLGYYFSTNLFFIVTVLMVFLFETLHLIESPDVLFWAQLTVFTSTIRMTLVIMISTYVFKYFSIKSFPSFIGAGLFASSVIYFRHVTYWEFFADAFLFVPLLILGVEKIIREQKPGWFLFAVAATLFNNFYFAYITLLFIGIYILGRWLIPLQNNETSKLNQVKLYAISGWLGFGIASPAFIPTVYAYLHNYRPAFNQERPLLDLSDNILLDSRTFLLSGIIVLFLFVFSFYKNRIFRLFATLTILFILFHFSPFMGSVFNGFSAPRNRFEYLGFFVAGGMVATGLQMIRQIKKTQVLATILLTLTGYVLFAFFDRTYEVANIYDQTMIIQLILVIATFTWMSFGKRKAWMTGGIIVLLVNAGVMNSYQYDKLYQAGDIKETTKDYILSSGYASAEQQELMDRLAKEEDAPFYRTEWRGTDRRNNTPLIQGFNGTSVYSSILNEHILFWYYEDLEIDMKRESISRYSGFGDRANLYSLLSGKYIMVEKGSERTLPYGFQPFIENEDYQVYQNTNVLPFVRTTNTVYSEGSLKDASMIAREHAMLEGVILEDPEAETSTIEPVPDLMDQVDIERVRASYSDGQLIVTGETGGIDLKLPTLPSATEDLYVSFHLKNNVKEASWFPLHVNDFKTSRKSRESFYRTGINKMTIRVPKDEKISLRVPTGNYQLTDLEIHAENYQTLERVHNDTSQADEVDIDGNDIDIELHNEQNNRYMTIPVPYEKGWHVTVNGKRKEVLKSNYAFLGVELEDGKNDISFTYRPPYFNYLAALSLLSVLFSMVWAKRRRRPRK